MEVLHDLRDELGVREIVVLDLIDHVKWASKEDNERIKSYCASWIVGSVTDAMAVTKAVRGCDAVIHMASAVDTGTTDKQLLYNVNVKGTDTIIAACMNEPSVKALVYCSSMDAVCCHIDFRDKDGVTEDDVVYCIDDKEVDCSRDIYSTTKALAEKRVLRANRCLENPNLRTGVVRPVGLYGERDTVHVGTLMETGAKLGSLSFFRFGDGSAVFQHVYARNCAYMHVLLAKKLVEHDSKAESQIFFGIDHTKVNNFFDFFRPYLAMKGYRVQTVNIPEWLLYPIFAFVEDVFLLVRAVAPSLVKNVNLKISRRAIQGTCVTAWFNSDKAKRLLGYEPLISPMEARKRTLGFFATHLLDVFPQGTYKYRLGEYDYEDDGKDFRPTDEKYLKRKAENETERKRTGKSLNRTPMQRARFMMLIGGLTIVAIKLLK